MEKILIGVAVIFILGLLFRKKGDGFMDTMGEGCSAAGGCIVWIIIGLVVLVAIALTR